MVDFSSNVREARAAADRMIAIAARSSPFLFPRPAPERQTLMMDLCAADGVNGNAPLDWGRLLSADDANFVHDVGGIHRHIDRTTGRLGDHFMPRFTLKTAKAGA